MEDPSGSAAKKTSLFRCTAAVGLFVSLWTPILWPSPAIAQQSSQVATSVNFFSLTGSTPNIPSALRWRTLPAEGTLPRKQSAELCIEEARSIVTVRLEEWPTPRIGPDMQLAPVRHSRMSHGLPELFGEDTAFSTRVWMPIADVWGGRLQMDGFYLELSANSMFRGLPQSSDSWWAAPASLRLRPATSYGIHLSFRLCRTRTRTLYHYLFRGGA